MKETVKGAFDDLIRQLRGAPYQFGILDEHTPVHHVAFDPGLTGEEILRIEEIFDFKFPADLKTFLEAAVPRGPLFPDWRSSERQIISQYLDAPRQGILFDVENGVWPAGWGNKPRDVSEAIRIANKLVDDAPKLIPIFSHRMMPEEPKTPGNPVFSIHQTDIIPYGYDLIDYFRAEFNLPGRTPWPHKIRSIPFWTELMVQTD